MLVAQLYTLRNNCIRQFTGRDAVRTTKLNLRDLRSQRNCLCKMTGMTALHGLLSGLELWQCSTEEQGKYISCAAQQNGLQLLDIALESFSAL